MRKDFIKFYVETWVDYHFTLPFAQACVLLTLISCFKYKKDKVLMMYCLGGIVVLFQPYLWHVILNTNYQNVLYTELTNTLFELIELSFFRYFYINIINNHCFKRLSRIILCLSWLCGLTLILILISTPNTSQNIFFLSFLFNLAEFLLLSIPCAWVFINIMKNKEFKNNRIDHILFVNSTLFFYIVIMIPFFFFFGSLNYEDTIVSIFFSMHFFSLGVLFIALRKVLLKGSLFQQPDKHADLQF
jgi:hypothetical protein